MEAVLLEHFPAGLDAFSAEPYFEDEELFADAACREALEGEGLLGAEGDLLGAPLHACYRGAAAGPGEEGSAGAAAAAGSFASSFSPSPPSSPGFGYECYGLAASPGGGLRALSAAAAAAGALRGGAAAVAAGGQRARAAADAVHQRRLRGPALAHPHAALREAPLQGGHAAPRHRLHQLPQRAGPVRPALARRRRGRRRRRPQSLPGQEGHHLPPGHKITFSK